MGFAPRLSLCIPTMSGREPYLKVCLASAIQEALAHPQGTVEVLVSVNGSPEAVAVVGEFQRQYPWVRCAGFPDNRDFDCNYLNCFQEARGEFVWVMGDDDLFLPGAVAPVLAAMDAGADAILCAAYEFDADLKPLQPREWFRKPTPAKVWQLRGPRDLIGYLDSLQRMAGAFGFISAAVIRRERFLAGLGTIRLGMGTRFVHVLGMMVFLSSPCALAWIPQPLFGNRTGNDGWAVSDPYARMIHDMNAWQRFADICFPEPGPLREAFLAVLRRDHQDGLIRGLRLCSAADRDRWEEATGRLLAVGYDPVLVRTVDYAYRLCMLELLAPRNLDAKTICLADLHLVTRGARRVAVLAEIGLRDFLASTALLEALRLGTRDAVIRVVCSQDQAPLLAGFELQVLDWDRFRGEETYREAQLDLMRTFAPDLLVNLDRERRAAGDFFAANAGAAGVLGFDNETAENRHDAARLWRCRPYGRVLPKDAPYRELAEALGLPPAPERLWPDPASLAQVRTIFEKSGWDPGRTLVVLGDDPVALAGPGALQLEQAMSGGWTAIGLGGAGTEPVLGKVLQAYGAQALNGGGVLSLATMAAILQASGACLGGSPTFQALAGAAGCRPLGGGRA